MNCNKGEKNYYVIIIKMYLTLKKNRSIILYKFI